SKSSLQTGWALSKPRSSVRFSPKVKEYLTALQSFFSRMAAARRKEQGVVGLSTEKEEDIQCLQEYSEREDLINTVNEEINVAHPICFDSYDLCERYHSNTLQEFNVAMLRSICNQGQKEIPLRQADSHDK
ncbi:unnamed protein product, partial [Porites lobata]